MMCSDITTIHVGHIEDTHDCPFGDQSLPSFPQQPFYIKATVFFNHFIDFRVYFMYLDATVSPGIVHCRPGEPEEEIDPEQ